MRTIFFPNLENGIITDVNFAVISAHNINIHLLKCLKYEPNQFFFASKPPILIHEKHHYKIVNRPFLSGKRPSYIF